MAKPVGFSLLETLIAVGLLVVVLTVVSTITISLKKIQIKNSEYYKNRTECLNDYESGEGKETPLTKNIVIKTIAYSQISIEYLQAH